MKTVKGKPITGATKTQMRPAAIPKTPSTSSQAEKMVKQPPQPFANRQGAAMRPAGVGSGVPTGDGKSKNMAGLTKSPAPSATSVKSINKQVGGKGTYHPSKHADTAAEMGVKSKRNAAFYGSK